MAKFTGKDDPKYKAFYEAAEPLMKWLADNVHPHHTAIVDASRAELLEGCATHINEAFLKD